MCVYIYIHIYVYTRTYIHTCMHTCMLMWLQSVRLFARLPTYMPAYLPACLATSVWKYFLLANWVLFLRKIWIALQIQWTIPCPTPQTRTKTQAPTQPKTHKPCLNRLRWVLTSWPTSTMTRWDFRKIGSLVFGVQGLVFGDENMIMITRTPQIRQFTGRNS